MGLQGKGTQMHPPNIYRNFKVNVTTDSGLVCLDISSKIFLTPFAAKKLVEHLQGLQDFGESYLPQALEALADKNPARLREVCDRLEHATKFLEEV